MRELRGAFVLFFAIVLVSVGLYLFRQYSQERDRGAASSLAQTRATVRLGIDPYAGYFVFRSTDFRDRLLAEGYGLSLRDDGGDYEARVEALHRGDLDMAVFTVDSFLLNGEARDYPGSIVAVLSESKGSDALVGRADAISGIDDLKDGSELKIAVTENSPSHHLLKALAVDFGIDALVGSDRSLVKVGGSEEALELLEKGTVPLAVLWEPDVSKALQSDDYVKLIGSESSAGLIVDILVARHEFIQQSPDVLKDFLSDYFEVLETLRSSPSELERRIASDADVSKSMARSLIDGIEWKGLSENAYLWFGAVQDGATPVYKLYDSVERTVRVLIEFGDFSKSPIPYGDPRSVILDTQILNLAGSLEGGGTRNLAQAARDFRPLTPAQWAQLASVGTLRLRPISFQSGVSGLSETGEKEIEEMLSVLNNYPDFRIKVTGHTSARGDEEANRALSKERAQIVAKHLIEKAGIDPDRVMSEGVGGDRPLVRQPGESFRAYQNRLSRVEFTFLRDTY